MSSRKPNYAFVDSQNLNLAIRELGWRLDFRKFRIYLKDKYAVEKAYLFIGYLPQNVDLYAYLQEAGFICIFRPTLLGVLLIPNQKKFSALLKFDIFKTYSSLHKRSSLEARISA